MRAGRSFRLGIALLIVGVLIWRVGGRPFVDGLRQVDLRSLIAAVLLTGVSSVCCAWRWSVISRAMGMDLPLRTAVPAYYRSQLLNVALPGGIIGDAHRAVRHGRDTGNVGRGVRAVALERVAGQVVLLILTAAVLLLAPSPLRAAMPWVAAVLGFVAVIAVLVAVLIVAVLLLPGRTAKTGPPGRVRRMSAVVLTDLRTALLSRARGPVVTLASAGAVAAHVAAFLVAARTAGVTAPIAVLVPLALLVLVVMGLPTSIGGWGPREGMAAWVFGAAGLGSGLGVSTAVVYGVMVLVGCLPGALVLLADRAGNVRAHRPDGPARPVTPVALVEPAGATGG